MVKPYSQYICQQCGYAQVGWFGKCPNCDAWNSAVETVIEKTPRKGRPTKGKLSSSAKPIPLSVIPKSTTSRISTKIPELDRVVGGGLVAGQVILLAGEPGIGKSTILLQLANNMGDVLYISGEESVGQINLRAQRLKVTNKRIDLLEETDVDSLISIIEEVDTNKKINLVIVDSIQTIFTQDLSGMAGSVGQVRESASRLVRLAKAMNIPLIIVGHVTKQGSVAGPAVLMHIVDTVLWFEGDRDLSIRLLRAVKNRFGPTDEVGIFSMEEMGLVSQENFEGLFVTKNANTSGSVITSVMQGTRPVITEVQALVVPTKSAFPKRIAQGYDSKRFELMLAILTRRSGIPLYDSDAYLNVSGGINIKEPGADLAVCLALASSYFDKTLPKNCVALGEVGLLGDIRGVVMEEKRIKEAKRLGYRVVINTNNNHFLMDAIKKYLK